MVTGWSKVEVPVALRVVLTPTTRPLSAPLGESSYSAGNPYAVGIHSTLRRHLSARRLAMHMQIDMDVVQNDEPTTIICAFTPFHRG